MIKYFSAEARARRARARERFNLAAELREMTIQRRYHDAREPYIMARVAELDRLDSGKYTEAIVGSPGPSISELIGDARPQWGAGIARGTIGERVDAALCAEEQRQARSSEYVNMYGVK